MNAEAYATHHCPKCNFPDGPGDHHYKGIYTSGEKCGGCPWRAPVVEDHVRGRHVQFYRDPQSHTDRPHWRIFVVLEQENLLPITPFAFIDVFAARAWFEEWTAGKKVWVPAWGAEPALPDPQRKASPLPKDVKPTDEDRLLSREFFQGLDDEGGEFSSVCNASLPYLLAQVREVGRIGGNSRFKIPDSTQVGLDPYDPHKVIEGYQLREAAFERLLHKALHENRELYANLTSVQEKATQLQMENRGLKLTSLPAGLDKLLEDLSASLVVRPGSEETVELLRRVKDIRGQT